MWFTRKEVLCTNCGFLYWVVSYTESWGSHNYITRNDEATIYQRDEFQNNIIDGIGCSISKDEPKRYYPYSRCNIACLRKQWERLDEKESSKYDLPNIVTDGEIRKPRECIFYMDYHPGYGPEDHKELNREDEMKRTMIKASLSGAAIGALFGSASAIVTQLIFA